MSTSGECSATAKYQELPKIPRPRYGNHVPALHPRCVESLPIVRVNLDLGVKLSRWRNQQRARRLPRYAIVVADQKDHGRRGALRTLLYRAILRKENVDVTVGVRRQRRLPLISRGVSDALLRAETGGSSGRVHACHREKQADGELLHTSRAAGP
jgi:hypothetical protein